MFRARTRRTPAAVLLLTTVGLLVSGCSGSHDKAASTSTATTTASSAVTSAAPATHPAKQPPPAPPVAQCRDLAYRDVAVFFNDTQPVPCSSTHTAYTFAVEQLPSRIAFPGVKIQNDAIQNAAADRCHAAFRRFVGGNDATRALARLSVTYFVPRQVGFHLGARWVRCDVVALKTARSLAPLPAKLQGFLDSPSALTTYGVCSKGKPGVSRLLMCSERHEYRALAAIRLGNATAPYPGVNATINLGTQRCKKLVAKQLGVTSGFTYSWTYPSTTDWAAGQRFGYCWNQTNS
jgi:putative regulator of septum formation